jgi:hypothetical protein
MKISSVARTALPIALAGMAVIACLGLPRSAMRTGIHFGDGGRVY